ncbi:MAG: N-acetylmuramoyl-L-alanine amidase [Candidatus Omnitrophota bacterium]
MICGLIALAGCAGPSSYIRLDPSLSKDIRTFDSIQYVPLTRLCDTYGLRCAWDQFTSTAVIERNGKRVVVRAGSKVGLVNGEERSLEKPVLITGGTAFVPVSFVKSSFGEIISVQPPPPVEVRRKFSIRTVVVDAGHGGKDRGATGRRLRLKEKDLTLAMAKKLRDRLEANGIRVIMTRSDDTFIPLPRRAEIANRAGADLFVSVHVNASRSRSLRGFECYYLSNATDDNARAVAALENAPLSMEEGTMLAHSKALDKTLWDMALTENRQESAELAGYICKAVGDSLAMKDRGTRSARFYVLKGTRMPAVLVEMGYISNRYEELKLKDGQYVDKMIDAVTQGILSYKREFERTEGFTEI